MKFLIDIFDLPSGIRVALYGAGKVGRYTRHMLEQYRKDITVTCYIDTYQDGIKDGLEVVRISRLSQKPSFDHIIVTSSLWPEIVTELDSRGITTDYSVLHHLLNFGHFFTEEEFKFHREKIEAAANILSFSEDRGNYLDTIHSRIISKRRLRGFETAYSASIEAVCPPFRQYPVNGKLYLDFINTSHMGTIIEGGVYKGGNTSEFLDHIPENGHIYGFEPYLETYESSKRKAVLDRDPRVTILPMGLWHTEEELFLQKYDAGSSIVRNPGTHDNAMPVPLTSVDVFIAGNGITSWDYMKLDVENAELPVLQGSVDSLKKFRPQLAICIYHTKFDMYEIPLFLGKILDDYIFRVGHYSDVLYDTVFYAIPKEIYQ